MYTFWYALLNIYIYNVYIHMHICTIASLFLDDLLLQIMNAWIGAFFFLIVGVGSTQFRSVITGNVIKRVYDHIGSSFIYINMHQLIFQMNFLTCFSIMISEATVDGRQINPCETIVKNLCQ